MATEFGKRIQGLIDKRKATRKTKGVVSGKSSGGGLSSAGAGGKGFAKGKRIKFGKGSKGLPTDPRVVAKAERTIRNKASGGAGSDFFSRSGTGGTFSARAGGQTRPATSSFKVGRNPTRFGSKKS